MRKTSPPTRPTRPNPPAPPRRRGACPGVVDAMESGDGWLLRARLPGGAISPAQLHVVADVSERWGCGVVEITTRANLQVRGVAAGAVADAGAALVSAGLADPDPAVDARRAVVASPLTGYDPTELVDARATVAAVLDALAAAELPGPLPAKFGVVIDSGGRLGVADVAADVCLRAVPNGAGALAWWLGAGPAPLVDAPTGDTSGRDGDGRGVDGGGAHRRGHRAGWVCPAEPGRVAEVVAGIAALCASHGVRGAELPPAALAACLARCGGLPSAPDLRHRGAERGEERTAGVLAGTGGTVSVVAAALVGRLDVPMVRALADAARAAQEARLTTTGAAALVGLPPAAVDATAATLRRAGWLLDPGDPALGLSACIGAPGCASARADTWGAAREIVAGWRSQPGPHTRLHLSACEKRCGAPPGPPQFADAGADAPADARGRAVTVVADEGGRFDASGLAGVSAVAGVHGAWGTGGAPAAVELPGAVDVGRVGRT